MIYDSILGTIGRTPIVRVNRLAPAHMTMYVVQVKDEEAIEAARALAAKEGIFCGISSGATFAAALEVARKAPQGSVILAMLPDTGERYLTTALFEGINDGSDAEPL